MPLTDDDLNVGQKLSNEQFDFANQASRGLDDIPTLSQEEADARKQKIKDNLNSMSAPQRARSLRRLEEQAATHQEVTSSGTAADAARTAENRGPNWVNNVTGAGNRAKKQVNLAKRRAKRWITGLVIVSVFSLVGTIFGILPHKLDLLAKQMEDRLYSRVEDYLEKRNDKMLWRYLAVYVFGNKLGAASCIKAGQPNFTVHSDCFYRENRNDYPKTKLGQMYRVWKEKRLERRILADINIHYAPNGLRADGTRGQTWVISLPSGEVPIDPDRPELGMTKAFTTIDVAGGTNTRQAKTAAYKQIMKSLKEETKAGLILRMRASIHLKAKYGLVRCIFYCDKRDAASDAGQGLQARIDEKKVNIRTAWHGFLAQRVFGSINARAGLFMGCMFQGSKSCTEDNTEFRAKYQGSIDKLRDRFGNEKIDDVLKLAQEYGKFRAENGNFAKFIGNKILEKIASKVAGTSAGAIVNVIPIIGQIIYIGIVGYEVLAVILLTYNIYTYINSAEAQYASTAIKAGTYTSVAATMDTARDESRAVSSTIFNGAVKAVQSETIAPEQSLFWNATNVNAKDNPNLGALFARAAYAAETPNAYPYVCDDEGTKIEAGQVFCPSWRFNFPTPVRQFAKELPGYEIGEKITQSKAAESVQEVANDIVETVEAPMEAATAFAYEKATPKAVKEWVDKNFAALSQKLSNYMFAIPIKDELDLAGAKLYDAWALGKDWLVNDMLRGGTEADGKQFGMGARAATDKELVQLEDDYRLKLDEDYSKLSLFEKIFSDQHERTVVSQLAFAMPSNANQALRMVSPATAFNLASTITRGDSAYAALAPNAVHGGIPQYVYSNSTLENAPLRATDDDTPCPVDRANGDGKLKAIGDSGTTDMGLGRAEFTTENPCLLDDYAIGVNTDYFTNEPMDPTLVSATATSGPSEGDGSASGQFAWPIAEDDFWHTTSCYKGPGRPDHYGLDMQGKKGNGKTVILAADGGTVIDSGFNSGMGYYVKIKHGKAPPNKEDPKGEQHYYTIYMHLYSADAIKVKKGKVTKGQPIGLEGTTGDSTGPHLHFTLARGKASNSAEHSVNPLVELKKSMPAGSSYAKHNGCPIP